MNLKLKTLTLCVGAILASEGCRHGATVTPRIVESHGASYDGSERNSGVLGFVDCGNARCVLVTAHFRERFNSLIVRYGRLFDPPITPDYGVTATGTNTFVMTKEAMQKSGQMHAWRASGMP